MHFLYPEWLQGFWLVLIVLLFFIWAGRKKTKQLQTFIELTALPSLTQSHSKSKEKMKKLLVLGALIFLVLTLARPEWGEIKREIKRKGVEMIFLVDTSLSMLAEDIAPSRTQKAKLEMKSFLKQLKGDRVGIVTFAGSGFVQSPLTLDYDAFLLFSNSIQVGYIPDAGTSLSEAIRSAVNAFPKSKQKNHVVIMLSDGEHLEGDVASAVKIARETKVRIYTIGIGTKEGAPIPLRSEQGKVSGYKKDRNGEVVITQLNEDLLRHIAEETGGLHFPATPSEREVEWIYQHLQNLEKKEFKQRMVTEREDHFQIFLGFSILLLLLEMLMGDVKKGYQLHG